MLRFIRSGEPLRIGTIKEALIKLITFMIRQAHHERNQYITVRPEPVEGLNQSFLKFCLAIKGSQDIAKHR